MISTFFSPDKEKSLKRTFYLFIKNVIKLSFIVECFFFAKIILINIKNGKDKLWIIAFCFIKKKISALGEYLATDTTKKSWQSCAKFLSMFLFLLRQLIWGLAKVSWGICGSFSSISGGLLWEWKANKTKVFLVCKLRLSTKIERTILLMQL